jgi:hypothetical protein
MEKTINGTPMEDRHHPLDEEGVKRIAQAIMTDSSCAPHYTGTSEIIAVLCAVVDHLSRPLGFYSGGDTWIDPAEVMRVADELQRRIDKKYKVH